MFNFEVLKSPSATDDEFLCALNCAKSSIESALDNETVTVKVFGNTITIQANNHNLPIEMTALECKEKIKGSFCDSSGKLYPEFSIIIPQ